MGAWAYTGECAPPCKVQNGMHPPGQNSVIAPDYSFTHRHHHTKLKILHIVFEKAFFKWCVLKNVTQLLYLSGHSEESPQLNHVCSRLVEWSQDEILPSPLPILLRLQNICLHLEDDTPPPPGIPAPPPVDLKVSALKVKRKRGGELEISNSGEDTDVNASTQVGLSLKKYSPRISRVTGIIQSSPQT